MFRGYKCINKDAKEILKTLGFDPNVNRGWVLLRNGSHKGKPCQMHALINMDNDRVQYIDIHSDFIVDGRHKSKRGRRTTRWNELFEQIDHDQPCNAGKKLLAHYVGLREALNIYHERFKDAEGKA